MQFIYYKFYEIDDDVTIIAVYVSLVEWWWNWNRRMIRIFYDRFFNIEKLIIYNQYFIFISRLFIVFLGRMPIFYLQCVESVFIFITDLPNCLFYFLYLRYPCVLHKRIDFYLIIWLNPLITLLQQLIFF